MIGPGVAFDQFPPPRNGVVVLLVLITGYLVLNQVGVDRDSTRFQGE